MLQNLYRKPHPDLRERKGLPFFREMVVDLGDILKNTCIGDLL
jgi:hypothetical protein